VAGFILFGLGTRALGGVRRFWSLLPRSHRLPLNYFNKPTDFNFVGVLFQDGVSQTMFAYFINQGMIMRFLSAKSPRESRKALVFLFLVLMFLAAVAVSNAGWIGKAMVGAGMLAADVDPQQIFVSVASAVCAPGVFGFVMAALTAALMSTADTLLNATSAIVVNDIYRPYVRGDASDRHYLLVARLTATVAAVIGFGAVFIFASFKSIYTAHGAFTATVTPPMAAAVMMGAFWRRFNSPGALATIIGGAVCLGVSLVYPEVIRPFSFGVEQGGEYHKAWAFQRALYGLACSMGIGLVVTLLTPRPDMKRITGLVWGTIDEARRRFKGGEPSMEPGARLRLKLVMEKPGGGAGGAGARTEGEGEEPPSSPTYVTDTTGRYGLVTLAAADLSRLKAAVGDIVQLAHPNPIYGGLRSVQVKVGGDGARPGTARVPSQLLQDGGLLGVETVRVEKVL
jgi:SSS family solute:Na+ symporter